MIFALGDMVIFLIKGGVRPPKLPNFANSIFLFCRIIFSVLLILIKPHTNSNME